MIDMNQVSFNISEADMAEIEAAFQTIHDKLMPHLHTLSPKDRKELPQMGEKTFGFVETSVQHCRQNPELVPPYLDVDEFEAGFQGYLAVRSMHHRVSQIDRALLDTMALLGSKTYSNGLTFYNSTKPPKSPRFPMPRPFITTSPTASPGEKEDGGKNETIIVKRNCSFLGG